MVPPVVQPDDNGNQGSKPDRPKPKQERPDKKDKSDKKDRADRNDKANRNDKADRNDKANRSDKADRKDKKDRKDRADRNDKSDKRDRADRKDKSDRKEKKNKRDEKDHGSLPVPLATAVAGWLATIRRRLSRLMGLAGAQIRGTARIRKKAKGGMSGPPRVGSERPAGTTTCPCVRSAADWWRARLGSWAPSASTCIRHPT